MVSRLKNNENGPPLKTRWAVDNLWVRRADIRNVYPPSV